jgi:hypothetical protein
MKPAQIHGERAGRGGGGRSVFVNDSDVKLRRVELLRKSVYRFRVYNFDRNRRFCGRSFFFSPPGNFVSDELRCVQPKTPNTAIKQITVLKILLPIFDILPRPRFFGDASIVNYYSIQRAVGRIKIR